jgi:hypothetical protein
LTVRTNLRGDALDPHKQKSTHGVTAERDAILAPVLTTIVQVSSGPTTAEFIVSLLIVGVLGPGLGVFAGRWPDRRKFAHERKLKASDDLIARIDDVSSRA